MDEIWKDVVGYEGRYKVSNLGNVMSMRYRGHYGEKVLKAVQHYSGYKFVHLGNRNNKKIKLIHVAVAEAFIPNPYNKRFVNHIDGNKGNNCVDNLEWVTNKENVRHAIKTGLRDPHNVPRRYGSDNHASKPVYQFDTKGNLIKKWGGQSDAARALGCFPGSISNKVDKPRNTTLGYVWLSSPDKFKEWSEKPKSKRRNTRPINQYSVNGELVKAWKNISEIEENSGYNITGIRGCCNHDRHTHGGFIWRYADEVD